MSPNIVIGGSPVTEAKETPLSDIALKRHRAEGGRFQSSSTDAGSTCREPSTEPPSEDQSVFTWMVKNTFLHFGSKAEELGCGAMCRSASSPPNLCPADNVKENRPPSIGKKSPSIGERSGEKMTSSALWMQLREAEDLRKKLAHEEKLRAQDRLPGLAWAAEARKGCDAGLSDTVLGKEGGPADKPSFARQCTEKHYDCGEDLVKKISQASTRAPILSTPEDSDEEASAALTAAAALAAHEAGTCSPCLYHFLKADGCRKGDDCTFCHLCEKAVVVEKRKQQKQQRRAEMEQSGLWRHRNRRRSEAAGVKSATTPGAPGADAGKGHVSPASPGRWVPVGLVRRKA